MENKYVITEQKAIIKKTYANVKRELTFEQYIGYRLKQVRKDNGISQQELAKKLNLTRTSICNIEVGRQGVSISTLKKYCDIFNLSSFQILNF